MAWIDSRKRMRIYERDGYKCRYCGIKLPYANLSLDHIQARSKGGNDSEDNLVTACAQCQWRKMAKTVKEANMTLLPIENR